MTPIKSNPAPLTKRISALAVAAAAALSLSLFSPAAHAAESKELLALRAALANINANSTVETASPSDLAAAVSLAISNNLSYKPGNIAGEALKHNGDENAGDEVEVALAAAVADDLIAVTDAIKRAGSGKDANVRLVPGFAAQFLPDAGDNSATLALAKKVIATKPGTGAVIGGRAMDLAKVAGAQQTEIETLVNQALVKTAGISAAAQDITKYAAAQLDADGGDTATLALNVSKVNISLAQKVSIGAVAGDPTNGGPIIDTVLSDTSGVLSKLKSGVLPLVKGAAAVADIEEISEMAYAVGKQIGTESGAKTAIAFSKAAGVVKALASAIVAKSTTVAVNNVNNKGDEIAETAAAMVGQILNKVTVIGPTGGKGQVNAKTAPSKIYAIVTSAVNVAKSAKVQAANQGLYADLTVDVVASVAETLGALRDATPDGVIPDSFFDGIKTYLRSKAKTIAGKSGVAQSTIENAIDAAYASGASATFEDGTIVTNITTADPETDFRPF